MDVCHSCLCCCVKRNTNELTKCIEVQICCGHGFVPFLILFMLFEYAVLVCVLCFEFSMLLLPYMYVTVVLLLWLLLGCLNYATGNRLRTRSIETFMVRDKILKDFRGQKATANTHRRGLLKRGEILICHK